MMNKNSILCGLFFGVLLAFALNAAHSRLLSTPWPDWRLEAALTAPQQCAI